MCSQQANDFIYMRRALELAARGLGRTSPNPMVGAVIVKNEKIIGEGYHLKAGTPHAEIHALNAAGKAAAGGTLYVTLEPCSHYGQTPPCSQAVIEAGLTRVVAAMVDPNPEVSGRGLKQMAAAGIKVESGVLEDEARQLNEVFIKFITTRLPFVVLKSAVTWDGKTATRTGHSFWVTGPRAREQVHRMRDQYDAIMVGIGTVLADNPQLTTRLPTKENAKDPVRIVVDTALRLPLEARVINSASKVPLYVVTTPRASVKRRRALEERGVEIIIIDTQFDYVDLPLMFKILGKKKITSILLEGGATLNASALDAGLVDKVVTFIAPKIVGGKEAPGMIGGLGKERMDQAWPLKEIKVENMGEDLMLTGYIQK